jgi:pyruvate dehydrogenase E2 component (dihydrolipoamide acetyltransferase)
MIKKVKLAKINLTMQTGRIVRWLKKEGDRVDRDEPLLEVETDKAVNTVESFHSGYLKKILVGEDQEVPVDTLIAYIGDAEDEVPSEVPPGGAPPESGEATERAQAAPGGSAGQGGSSEPPLGRPSEGGRALNASPLARRLAAELGVDLAAVQGTGPDGRIGKQDVVAASERGGTGAAEGSPPDAAARASSGVKILPLSGLKRTSAERMKASYLEAPHIHLDMSVDVGRLEALRTRLNAGAGGAGEEAAGEVRYTLTDLIVRAASLALGEFPMLNAAFRDGGIALFSEQGMGVAVSPPGGWSYR